MRTERYREGHLTKEAEIGVMQLEPPLETTTGNHQKLGDKQGRDSPSEQGRGTPSEPTGEANLFVSRYQTSGLLNCERVNFCCTKPPNFC